MKKEYMNFYGEYADIIEKNEKSVMDELRRIMDNLTSDPEHAPAEHILSRVKDPKSLTEKLRKEGVGNYILPVGQPDMSATESTNTRSKSLK